MIEVKDHKISEKGDREKVVYLGKTPRKSFAKTRFDYPMPNLVEIQTESFKWFLNEGFAEVLKDSSPIVDQSKNYALEYTGFRVRTDLPNYSIEEAKQRDANYHVPMYVDFTVTDKTNGDSVAFKDQFLCDLPMMTPAGTFVINGAERVIVSQILRSPGMYYDYTIDKAGKKIYTAQVIPYRGAWLEYEVDAGGVFWVHIDKNRKMPMTLFLNALGFEDNAQMLDYFGVGEYWKETFTKSDNEIENMMNQLKDKKPDWSRSETALRWIYTRVRPGDPATKEAAETLMANYFFDERHYDIQPVGRYMYNKKANIISRIRNRRLAENVNNPYTGDLVAEAGQVVNAEVASAIAHACVNEAVVYLDNGEKLKVVGNNTAYPEDFLGFSLKDCGVREMASIPVMADIREKCEGDIDAIREMAKARLGELCPRCMTKDDIFASISYLIGMTHEVGARDDIDHLGNRRIRSVGEQLQNQLRIGFARMDKLIKERMATSEREKIMDKSIINIRPIGAAIREFFGSSQLSQFMDQNNPLAELTHKRRISALGPGGISRDRASFDVRDVHYTQYGRMCPVETPEGPNIGLINYMATYVRVDEYGFMMAPYRKVKHVVNANGVEEHYVTDEVEYMTADVQDNFIVAQANEPVDENGRFLNRKLAARERAEIIEVDPAAVSYMDVAPKMLVSVAAAMIPFLENDDNTRALMGSNMQKQAVPLMVTDSPIVGTGMEYKAAVDSGVVVVADRDGVVEKVQADEIVIAVENGEKDKYEILKYKRTNQGTCFNQRPIVKRGDVVKKGDVIADGPATCNGEISLGKNALIGFMTWEGYNYEDAVLLNEKLVREDVYTSLHIEEYTVETRKTTTGLEEITLDVPNIPDDAKRNLDANGVVRVGTEVHSGDILVGKVSPKGDTDLTPEQQLLLAIFGKKCGEVRDTSLRLAHGEYGVVVDVREFDVDKGDKLPKDVKHAVKVYVAQKRKISVGDKMAGRHGNKGVVSRILPPEDMPFLPDGTPLDIVLNPLGVPSRMNIGQVLEVHLGIAARKLGWKIMTPVFDGANEKDIMRWLIDAGLQRDLFPLENPEGKELYEEITEGEGKKVLRVLSTEERADKAFMDKLSAEKRLKVVDGKIYLRDGRTGMRFDNPVTVGVMYYLKLHHLVDDKIHARSNGPYSLITQQPLGGKAQFGGQRFGEMEVWALEAYGAAYTLQEILTVKSDDIMGRRKAYEAIIKGQNIPTPGVPESFKVMVRELRSLGLDVQVQDAEGKPVDLSQLCAEDDNYSKYQAPDGVEDMTDTELPEGMTLLDSEGNELGEEEYGYEEEEAYDQNENDDED